MARQDRMPIQEEPIQEEQHNEAMDEWHSGGSWSGSEETLVGYGGPIEQENHRNVRPATFKNAT